MSEVSYFNVSDGPQGTVESSVKLMQIAVDFATSPDDVVPLARKIVSSVDSRSAYKKACAIFWWIKKNIAYQRDPLPIEYYQTPKRLLQTRVGDCDCMSLLFCSTCLSVGVEVRYILIGSDINNPEAFNHIYCEALCNGKWVPFDCSFPKSTPGWEPKKNIYRKGYINMDSQFTEQGTGYIPATGMTGCADKPSCKCENFTINKVEICRPMLSRLPEFYRAPFDEPYGEAVETRVVDFDIAPFDLSTLPDQSRTDGYEEFDAFYETDDYEEFDEEAYLSQNKAYNTSGLFSKIANVVKKIPGSPLGGVLAAKDAKAALEDAAQENKRLMVLHEEVRKPILEALTREYDTQTAKLNGFNNVLVGLNKELDEIDNVMNQELLQFEQQLKASFDSDLAQFKSMLENGFNSYRTSKINTLAMYDIIMPK